MEAKGKCYQAAGEFLMDKAFRLGHEGLVLVHGRPTLQVEPFCEYGHAWIEYEVPFGDGTMTVCRDVELGAEFPLFLFYSVGNIDPDQCFRYTYPDLARWVTETSHWGPWEGPEACSPIKAVDDD